jgi:hypothetical protein
MGKELRVRIDVTLSRHTFDRLVSERTAGGLSAGQVIDRWAAMAREGEKK